METGMMLAMVIGGLIVLGVVKELLCKWLCANPKILAIVIAIVIIAIIYCVYTYRPDLIEALIGENSVFILVFIQVIAMFIFMAMKHYLIGMVLLATSLFTIIFYGSVIF